MSKTLLEVLTEQDIESFDSANGRRVAHCPFHDGDRSPSFTIYPNETYYCFGCHVWGNPVKFLIDYKGMSAKEAMEYVGVDYEIPKSEKRVIKIKNYVKTTKFLYSVAEQYNEYLMTTNGPIKYLTDRGLTLETIAKYGLGYTDGSVLDFTFVEEYEIANEIGLLSKNGYEALSHRIVIPNVIDKGHCDFMIGRTVINDKVKYLGLRMPKPIMGFYEVRQSPIIFLVEGQFDWLILRQWGYPAAVISGSHITRTNAALLFGKKVVYIPDNDDAGLVAARKIEERIVQPIILNTNRFGTKDISEAAQTEGAREVFDELVKEQLWQSNSYRERYQKWLPISMSSEYSLST